MFNLPLPQLSLGLAVSLASLSSAPAYAAEGSDVGLSVSQSIYALGDTAQLSIDGPAGGTVCLVFGTAKGEFEVGGIGTLGLDADGILAALDGGSLSSTGQLDFGFEISCDQEALANIPLFAQVLVFPAINPLPACVSEVIPLRFVNGECERCIGDTGTDSAVSTQADGFAIDAPGLGGRFRFMGASDIHENTDGTATVSAFLEGIDQPNRRFGMQIQLSGRLDCGDAAFPPSSGPDLKLLSSAYLGSGGSIDPNSWHYYTAAEGQLAGFGDAVGASVRLDLNGPVQVGLGADGRSTGFGLCADFTSSILTQPEDDSTTLASDNNVSMVTGQVECAPTNVDKCATNGEVDDHSFWIRDYAPQRDWMFVDGPGRWREFTDGTALLEGRIENVDDSDCCFDVSVRFDNVLFPGQFGHPPAGSPQVGSLDPALLMENGGPVDSSTFHYYTTTEGVMFGCKDFEGAVVRIDRRGTSYQVGTGANEKDQDFGASGWLYAIRLEGPDGDKTLPESSFADINVDLANCPDFMQLPVLAYNFSSLAGTTAYESQESFDLEFNEADGEIDWVLENTTTGLSFNQSHLFGEASLVRPAETDNEYLLKSLQDSNAFTVQAFFRQNSMDVPWARIVTFSSSTNLSSRNFSLIGRMEDGQGQAVVRMNTNHGVVNEFVDATWDAGEPVSLAMSYDRIGGAHIKVYLNGVEVDRISWDGGFEDWVERPFVIGNEAGGGRPFGGELYDVKIWNRPLSEGELLEQSTELHAGL